MDLPYYRYTYKGIQEIERRRSIRWRDFPHMYHTASALHTQYTVHHAILQHSGSLAGKRLGKRAGKN